jgi:hypothetical protein
MKAKVVVKDSSITFFEAEDWTGRHFSLTEKQDKRDVT